MRLDHPPALTAFMTPFPHSVDLQDPLSRAVAMLDAHEIRHLPVTEGGRLVGVLTAPEVAAALAEAGGKQRRSPLRVRDVRVLDAYTVELTERFDRVLAHMARQHIECALVLKRGKLVGIFTVTDACWILADLLRRRFPDDGGEDAA